LGLTNWGDCLRYAAVVGYVHLPGFKGVLGVIIDGPADAALRRERTLHRGMPMVRKNHA